MAEGTFSRKVEVIYKNTGLFADYFLTEKLPLEKRWLEASTDETSRAVFDQVKALYEQKKSALPGFNEAQTEDELIKPILDLLGFSFIVQTPAKGMTGRLAPDYALFPDDAAKDKGYEEVQQGNYTNVLAVADAKYWDRPLDKQLKDSRDRFTNQNPTFQISSYLIVTKAKWAILTNGKIWRLYSRDLSRTIGEYYQVNLAEILESGDLNNWLYFYLFFHKEAFQPAPEKSFLDQVVQESVDYGAELRENLKSQIFEKIFIFLARGFAARRKDDGTTAETPETLKEIFDNTLILLYRLLFILYAESLDLLPAKETAGYHTKSISKLKAEIKNDIETGKVLSRRSTDYWDDLVNLFRIIDRGDPDLNVPKYNGGLFSADHRFLSENKISDYHLAEAVYPLTTYSGEATNWNNVFIDYGMLGVKQLGSVYEGLLEFHLNIADQELAVVKEKGKAKYVPVGAVAKGQRDTGARIAPGELYLENTKAERKATGSYYTPDYIVEYIVESTVGPLVGELEAAFEAKIDEFKHDSRYRGASAKWKTVHIKEHDPALKALELKICDPAMGSGHFLVTTVDYISQRIYDILAKSSERVIFGDEPYQSPLFRQIQEIRDNILAEIDRQQVTIDKAKLEDDKVIIRRMVMKRCVFGVDLNYLAVELAKLSLWLNSFTVGAPLSFLDHHLKAGNSLIGFKDISQVVATSSKTFQNIQRAITTNIAISGLTDTTVNEVEKSTELYEYALELLAPIKRRFNVGLAARYFMGDDFKGLRKELQTLQTQNLEGFALGEQTAGLPVEYRKAQDIAQDKAFFHWELEFPEVFYSLKGKLEGGGFDAVVGNPPYVRQEQLGGAKPFLARYEVYHGAADIYVYFYEMGHRLVRTAGYFGMITSNKFTRSGYGAPLRTWLENNAYLKQLIDFGDLPVFPEAAAYPLIFISQNELRDGRLTSYTPIKSLDFESLAGAVDANVVELPPSAFAGESWTLASTREQSVLQKMQTNSVALGDYITNKIQYGVKTGFNKAFFIDQETRDKLIAEDAKSAEIIKPLLVGEDIGRYAVDYKNRYLIWTYIGVPIDRYPAIFAHLNQFRSQLEKRWDKGKHWWELRSCDYYDKLEKPKIVLPDIAATCRFAYDDNGAYLGNTTYFLPETSFFLLALLNSAAIFGWYRNQLAVYRGGYLRFFDQYLKNIPIRRISFTTSPAVRQEKLAQVKSLYVNFLKSSDRSAILEFIAGLLEKEQSDVVHDFLAFLAEQMIAMNKAKQEETAGFLKYIERLIGVDIDTLANKTLLKEYHRHSFDQVIAVLERNKNKLKAFNPKSRAAQENLEKEFQVSVAKLTPLKAKIQATDDLIDQIVYTLYDLTNEEIAIVEGNDERNGK